MLTEPVYVGRRPGRPTLLTPEVEGRFLGYLMAGVYRNVAAEACGLKPDTVNKWVRRGRGNMPDRAATPEYVRFVRLVEQAEATATAEVESNIVRRSKYDHNAGLAWLRTRHPDRWPRFPGVVEDPDPYGPINPNPPMPQPQIGSSGGGDTNILILQPKDWPELASQLIAQQREARDAENEAAVVIEQETPQEMTVGVPRHERLNGLRVAAQPRD